MNVTIHLRILFVSKVIETASKIQVKLTAIGPNEWHNSMASRFSSESFGAELISITLNVSATIIAVKQTNDILTVTVIKGLSYLTCSACINLVNLLYR